MIQMVCPRCGAAGRIPQEKVNARLVCKKCLQVFHLKPGGVAVLGEPPATKSSPKVRTVRERPELISSANEGLGDYFAKIRLPDPKIIGVTLVVLMIIGMLSWVFSQESVETRSKIMASAIAKGDIGAVMPMVLPGTEGDAMKWFYEIHPNYLDLKKSMGLHEPAVQIQVQKTSDGQSAVALLVFSRDGAHQGVNPTGEDELLAPKVSKVKNSLEITLYWTPDTWGTWRLDAKRTAENPTRS